MQILTLQVLVPKLCIVKSRVQSILRKQLHVCPKFDNSIVRQHRDPICKSDGRQSMGDISVVRPCSRFTKLCWMSCSDSVSTEEVASFEDEDGRIFQNGTCNRDPLFLSAGETHTALPNNGVKAIWQAHDKVVDIGGFRWLSLFPSASRSACRRRYSLRLFR